MGQTRNGFDVSNASIPVEEILGGGPPRDGIPALTLPPFVPVARVDWLDPDDRLIAIRRGDAIKAYPLAILNWHEIVNDRIAGEPVVITYCPLCGTGMAFDPRVENETLEFGVSGLLYNSDVLMYDRATESLWSQIQRQAVSGPLRGRTLTQVPLTHTTWERWRSENPDGLVLSRETGYARDYERDPYASYAASSGTMFPVAHRDDRLPGKSIVLGIERDGDAMAFPLDALGDHPKPIRAVFEGGDLFVYWFPESQTAFATTLEGDSVPATIAYWFAWSAFHRDTKLWSAAGP